VTRAKTQGPGGKPPRATTQGGKPKRAMSQSGLFNDLEAAIDALDQSSARHAAEVSPKRSAPGPTPPSADPQIKSPPRTTPPKPPPGAPRAAATRAQVARAQSEVSLAPPAAPPSTTRPAAAPLASIPPPRSFAAAQSIDIDLEDPVPAAPTYANPRADDFEDSVPAARTYEARAVRGDARAISVGETASEDVVLEELPALPTLSIAILDDPPAIAAAKQAISVAGHKVIAAASGPTGIEQIKSLLRTGIADVLLVGLPGGEVLIDTALALSPRRPVVIATISGRIVDGVKRAAAAGADLAVARPLDADKLAPALLAAVRLAAERTTASNARGNETTMRGRLDAMADHEPGALQPFGLFERVLDLEIKRSKRYGYPISIALFSIGVDSDEPPPPGVQGILRARAGNALIHSIRDIDLATELDQERFLVLLPYTTLAGAAEVARRILNAVTSGNPITAAGTSFGPRITGAVAGAQSGQPLSFSRLMRDATQALEQAHRDGAELAVPMTRDR